jgi:RimJ/RimL family protein N-acetyltransferase
MFPDLLCDDVFRLETARLWLRWPRLADVSALCTLGGEHELAQMTASIPHPYTVQDASKWVFASRAGNSSGNAVVLALTLKERPVDAIGAIGLHGGRAKGAMLGFWLGRPYHGRGLMSEAAGAVVDLAFKLGAVTEIHARTRVENAAGRRVLEKCGFSSQGRGPVDLPARGGVFVCERYILRPGSDRMADNVAESATLAP